MGRSKLFTAFVIAALAAISTAPALAVPTSWNAYNDFYLSPTAAGWGGATSPSAAGAAWGYYMGNVNGGGFPTTTGTFLSTSQIYKYSSVDPLGAGGPVYSTSSWTATGGAGFAAYSDNIPWGTSLGSFSSPWFDGAPGFSQSLTNLIWLQGNTIGNPSAEGIASVLTWKAPAAGEYTFTGLFVSGNQPLNGASIAIVDSQGGTNPLSRMVLANNSQQNFSFTKSYSLGDVVQFQVGSNFATGNAVGLQVAVVPEPSTLALAGLGLAGAACYLFRRQPRRGDPAR